MTPKTLLLNGIPTVVIVGLVVMTVRGSGGLFDYWQLAEQAESAKDAWTRQERENNVLLLELQRLKNDPIQVERLAASELGYAGPGSVLYYFQDDGSAVPVH